MQKRLGILFVLMLLMTTKMLAQMTTSGINGMVMAGDDKAIGATVTAVHEPSGTTYNTVVNASGRYSINGMRVGGPYTIKVSYIGYTTSVTKDVTLQLAESYSLNVNLSEDSHELGEVVVSAKATKFTAEKTGASTNINLSQLENMPTVSRSITDFTRLSPYGGNGMSFAGTDGRTANFTVDGANFNNNFGLSDGLPGGGNPISIDAIEEMQVVISPYDVRQTNFIGGGVNAITKSGTNTFKGTAYVYHQNENMRGDAVDREQISGAREKDQKTTYGFTLGGPIIKNKLFFFVSGEMSKTPTVVNRWRGSVDGVEDADNYISRTTLADLEKVSNFVKDKYGYDTGSWTNFPADENNYKLLARLDWNITNMHHLSFRYNYTKNRNWNPTNASSMDGGTRSAYGRFSQKSMSYANSMYALDNLVHSFSIDLNSRFSDNLSNQFLATYSKLDDVRFTNSADFPFIDIMDGTGTNTAYISLGKELFTHNNAVRNTVWNIKDDVTYYAGSHKIMLGAKFEHQMALNSYMRNGTGYYRYYSLDDFLNGAAPEIVNLTYGYDGKSDPAATVRFNTLGIYIQDEWSITPSFKLTYGLRFDDMFFNNDDLMTNKAIYDLDYDGRHIDTGKWPGSNLTVAPRVGFVWDILGDKTLKLRGGSGIFQGRLPLVFFTNMPTNSGMVQYQAIINEANAAKNDFTMNEFAGGLVTNDKGYPTIGALQQKLFSLGYPETIRPEDGTLPSQISAVDPDFKMPEVWKTSLAVDYVVPVGFPLTVSAEGIFNKTIHGVTMQDWSIPDVGGFTRFNGVDNRPIFPTGYNEGVVPAYVLSNTSKGYGWSASVSAYASPSKYIDIMAAYTHTCSKELTGMPGSNASSTIAYLPSVEGPNNIKLHNSQYVEPDRVIAQITAHDNCNNHFSLIYEGWRGSYNYTYMLQNDMNGDGQAYDPIFIPTDAQVANNEFRFKTTDDRDRFMAYVHNNSYLKDHQGEYAEAYSLYSPWVHRFDFSYKHDFKLNVGKTKHMLTLSFDIKNVGNLFNSSWGVAKTLNPAIGSEAKILKYEGADADGYAVFSTPSAINGSTKTWTANHAIGQCWYMSIGVKYTFN